MNRILSAAALVAGVMVSAQLIADEPQIADVKAIVNAVEPGVGSTFDRNGVVNLSMQPLSNQELLKKGTDELNNKQYEEALATLQQVQPDATWDDATKTTFADMLAKAEKGANERRAARASFEKGEAALNAGDSVEAIGHYRAAAENRYADEGTRAKAREQIAVAENLARKASTDLKSVFASAKADFKAGQYTSAKVKFEQLKAAGYRTGLFEKSVADYLKETDERIAAGYTGTSVAQTPPPAPAPTDRPAETTPPTDPARVAAEQRYAESEARAAVVDRKKEARDAYLMGRDQYRRGDWQAARENLTQARNMGYKPGLFEDSPEKLLARMDAKEQADAASAAREARRTAEFEAAAKAALEAEAAAAAARAAEEAAAAEAARAAAAARDAEAARAAQAAPPPEQPVVQAPPVEQPVTPPPAEVPAVTPSDRVVQTTPTTPPPETPSAPTAMDELRKTVELTRTESEQNAFRARELVAQADTAAAAGKFDEALTLYAQAAALDPANAAATGGQARMMQLTNREPAARDLLEEVDRQVRARREAITYSFNNAIERANAAIAANNFRDAQAAVSEARIARAQDPTIFQAAEIAAFDATLADTQQRLDSSRVAFEQAQQAQAAADAAAAQAARLEAEALQRAQTIKDLRTTAMELTQQRKYTEALAVVNQIVELDPTDDYARSIQIFLMDQAQFQRQRKYREQFDRQFTEQLVESEEKRIPYSDILRYPENWPELSEMRDRSVDAERGASVEDQAVAGALERKLPDIDFTDRPFGDVVDFLRDITRANIVVNWRVLENAGVARDTPISAKLRDVKFSKVLTTILNDAGGGNVELDYTIDDGVITISTKEALSASTVTRVYDIRDLIINIPDFNEAPDFNLQQTAQVGGGGGGGSLFGGGGGGDEDSEGPTRTELVEDIIRLIEDTVDTNSWKTNGGSGSIRELQGQLIVSQTPENQRELVRLLEQLRETRAIQVTIEARFLRVQRNFLEDIGLDVDFAFANLDDRIINTTPGSPNIGTPGVIEVLQNTFNFNNRAGSLNTNIPGNLADDVLAPGGIGAAITTGITFLDDFQVQAIIRATQAGQSRSTVTAPRVTLFNGQRAYVLISTQRAYVSDLQPIVGTGAVGFDPTPAIVNTGAILDVQATVSSDRKYVTLTLRPQIAQLIQFRDFQVAQATAGGGGDGDGDAGVATGFIQQPEIQITEVRTTVSVPDGGTLLLGGQTIGGEIEREAGVPVLSKIPFLKRLFTNRSMVKDDEVLLILVKPTIIIQREQEQQQFPALSERAQP